MRAFLMGLTTIGISSMLSGCLFGHYDFVGQTSANPLQLQADGNTVTHGALSTIDGLTMFVASTSDTSLPLTSLGTGQAMLERDLLESFSTRSYGGTTRLTDFDRGEIFVRENGDPYRDRVDMPVTQVNQAYVSWGNHNFKHFESEALIDAYPYSYVLGTPTLATALPTSGVVRYEYRSPAYYAQDTITVFQGTAAMAVQWGAASTKIGVSVNRVDGLTPLAYFPRTGGRGFQTTGGLDESQIHLSEVSLIPGTATFSGTNIPVTESGVTLAGYSASLKGFFAGPNAESAAMVYLIADSANVNVSHGSVGFERQSESGNSAGGSSGGGGGSTPAFSAPISNPAGPLQMAHSGPDGFTPSNNSVSNITQNGTTGLLTRYEFLSEGFVNGSAQGADLGGDALITWGRWTNGTRGRERSYDPSIVDDMGSAMSLEQGLHYVLGQPSISLPATGTASYNLLGATSPTFADGTSPAGTVTSATLAVTWGGLTGSAVSLDMALTMPADGSYRVTTQPGNAMITNAGNFEGLTTPVSVTAGTGRACNGGYSCEATIKGFFAGDNGARAGLSYRITSGIVTDAILGAAAFVKQ